MSKRSGHREYAVICVEDEPEVRQALQRDVQRVVGWTLAVEACADAIEARQVIAVLRNRGAGIPLIIADHLLPGESGVELLIDLHENAGLQATRKVLLSGQANVSDVSRALNRGALNRHLDKPWTYEALERCIRDLLTDYTIDEAPGDATRFSQLIDLTRISAALTTQRRKVADLDRQLRAAQRSFLVNVEKSNEEVSKALIAAIDETLDSPPRQKLPAGTVMLRQGQPVEQIYILLDGDVEFSRRVEGTEVAFQQEDSGSVIGLLAVAQGGAAFFTCKATTDIIVIPLRLPELDEAFEANPALSVHFVTMLIRSLATRHRRVIDLSAEVEALNDRLSAERDALRDALNTLEAAQMRLVESEKLATLGQLAAGVAHELNNPLAGMQRAVDFIAEDIIALITTRPEATALRAVTLAALTNTPLSTREARAREAALANELGDEDLARRLMRMGITTAEEYRAHCAGYSPAERERRLALMERYYQLGSSLRNVTRCADHIARIVQSLRSYARVDESPRQDVNIHAGLEDTLLLFGPRLREVNVVKNYGDLPLIECRPGEINQVWSNLIANALEAMEEKGTLELTTEVPDPRHIRVNITDSGPGIPEELREKIFAMNYTTKSGQAQFGLGLGLAICRQIVLRHGGSIEVTGRPGRTTFSVTLPVVDPERMQERMNL
jgi:signal transduction histidine kinase/CheY-like chemotaxis protein